MEGLIEDLVRKSATQRDAEEAYTLAKTAQTLANTLSQLEWNKNNKGSK